MPSPSAAPPESRWDAAWRIEVDPQGRIRRLRTARIVASVGSAVAASILLVLLIGPWAGAPPVPAILLFLLVGYLFALAPALWWGLGWALRRIPDRIAFDDHGVLVHRVDGQVVDVEWANPEFALDLTNWGASDFSRGTIQLTSRMKNGFPEGAITVEGSAALRSEALGRGLSAETSVLGRPPKAFGVVELRPPLPPSATGSSTGSGAPTLDAAPGH
jgi:hypothetical protein